MKQGSPFVLKVLGVLKRLVSPLIFQQSLLSGVLIIVRASWYRIIIIFQDQMFSQMSVQRASKIASSLKMIKYHPGPRSCFPVQCLCHDRRMLFDLYAVCISASILVVFFCNSPACRFCRGRPPVHTSQAAIFDFK